MGPFAFFWGAVICLSVALMPLFRWLDRLTGSRREVAIGVTVGAILSLGAVFYGIAQWATADEPVTATTPAGPDTLDDPTLDLKPLYESRLLLIERYPNEWPLTEARLIDGNLVLNGAVLRRSYSANDPVPLTPHVWNRNSAQGVPLDMPDIAVGFRATDNIKTITSEPYWRPDESNGLKSLMTGFDFGPVMAKPAGVNQVISLLFPAPGRYPVVYSVEGLARGIALRTSGSFVLELVRP